PPPGPRVAQPEGQAAGGTEHHGPAAERLQRLRGRGRRAGPPPAGGAGAGDGRQRGRAYKRVIRADRRCPPRLTGRGIHRPRGRGVSRSFPAPRETAMKAHRLARVAEVVREVASETILYELRDPRVKMVTVTRAEVSGDLQHAKVHVSVMGTER